jgi:hypothetical protein
LQVHALATSMAVQVALEPNGASDGHAGMSCIAEARALVDTLRSVQREVERLKAAEMTAQKLAYDLQVCMMTLQIRLVPCDKR